MTERTTADSTELLLDIAAALRPAASPADVAENPFCVAWLVRWA